MGDKWDTEVRLGKDRIGKNNNSPLLEHPKKSFKGDFRRLFVGMYFNPSAKDNGQ